MTFRIVFLCVFLSLLGCEKEPITPVSPPTSVPTPTPEPEPAPVVVHERIGGYVQKGPFLNGTALQVSELDSNLTATGLTYTTQLLDNRGSFEIRNVELDSRYVQLQANGFYFNEVTNANSSAPLTLFALSDLGEKNGLNVNLLSSLEKGRLEYLLGTGSSFTEAKQQAQREILDIFRFGADDIGESELLDISATGAGNATLLAVSVILQGYLNVADFSEFLANISTDIRQDGVLDSKSLQQQLVTNAVAINEARIRRSLTDRYETMGITAEIPDFEPYVRKFLADTEFSYSREIHYPETDGEMRNLLDSSLLICESEEVLHLSADLPKYTTVRVDIVGGEWGTSNASSSTGWKRTKIDHPTEEYAWQYVASNPGSARTKVEFYNHFYRDTGGYTPPPPTTPIISLYENDTLRWSKELTVRKGKE